MRPCPLTSKSSAASSNGPSCRSIVSGRKQVGHPAAVGGEAPSSTAAGGAGPGGALAPPSSWVGCKRGGPVAPHSTQALAGAEVATRVSPPPCQSGGTARPWPLFAPRASPPARIPPRGVPRATPGVAEASSELNPGVMGGGAKETLGLRGLRGLGLDHTGVPRRGASRGKPTPARSPPVQNVPVAVTIKDADAAAADVK